VTKWHVILSAEQIPCGFLIVHGILMSVLIFGESTSFRVRKALVELSNLGEGFVRTLNRKETKTTVATITAHGYVANSGPASHDYPSNDEG
jgi:hypothetical protein